MKLPVWLEQAEALAIHEMMLAQHGGRAGVRDPGLLESALAKPQNLRLYGGSTLPELAASYAAGIIHNHPFLDGNKRAGFMLAATFLELNGLIFTASEESAAGQTLAFAAGEVTEAGYAAWLQANSQEA